jgi:hypothetical protein
VLNPQVESSWGRTPLIPALWRQRQADFWVRGQPGLQSEFQDSQGYTEKPCLEEKKKECRQATDNKRGGFSQTDNKSSLLKTGLTQNTVYEKGKLVPARTLTLMFQCPPYGRCFERYTKWNIYIEPTKKTLIYNFSFQQNMLRAMMSWIYWE